MRIFKNRRQAEVRFRRRHISQLELDRAMHRALLESGPPRIVV